MKGSIFNTSAFYQNWRLFGLHSYGAGYSPAPMRGHAGPSKWAFRTAQSDYRNLSYDKILLWIAAATATYYFIHVSIKKAYTSRGLYTKVNMPRILYIDPPDPVDIPPAHPLFCRPPSCHNVALTIAADETLNFSADIFTFFAPEVFEPGSITVVKFSYPIPDTKESTHLPLPYFTTFTIGAAADQPVSVFKNLPFFSGVQSGAQIRCEIFNTRESGMQSWRVCDTITVQ